MKKLQSPQSRLQFIRDTAILATGFTFFPHLLSARIRSTGIGPELLHGRALSVEIMIPQQASALEQRAGEELQKYLSTVPGARIKLIKELDRGDSFPIYLGRTQMAASTQSVPTRLDEDGYFIWVTPNEIILSGGAGKGLLYGVYELLEESGFKRYAATETQIPAKPEWAFTEKEKTITPKIKYRTTSYSEMANPEYADWHKLSSRDDWGLFVHTFETLVPAELYGKTHPEFYSLIDGVRSPATQLCLSNPEVLRVLIERLHTRVSEKPHAKYWSVSQNDNDRYCTCENCQALNTRYGAVPSGSIIWFVNQVARAFPDKIISTLAYWYSRKAPRNIQIEPNVNIMLCNIESSREAPVFVTDKAFSNDLKEWGALSTDILIWDYNIQFTNYVSPFPNLFTLKPNIEFYTANHVTALFMQANNEPAAEMALLRAYLIARLMWDPAADDNALINEFVEGYFGPAGTFIRRYIDLMQEGLVKSGMRLSIFGDPIHARETYLSHDLMGQYQSLFDQAEKAVKDQPELLKRVQTARLPLQYAQIQIGRTETDTPRSLFFTKNNGVVGVRPEMSALVHQFVTRCQRDGIKLLRERSGTPEHYLASYQRIFEAMAHPEKYVSYRKKIISLTPAAPKSKPAESLTDGIFASYESWQEPDQNWVYFTGTHMDLILDLGTPQLISSIQTDFLNPQAQPDWHLFSLPRFVTFSLSEDGTTYKAPLKVENPHHPNPKENPAITSISVFPFKQEFRPKAWTRFIKIHAESWLHTPAWHIRSGSPISIYCDQVVVQ